MNISRKNCISDSADLFLYTEQLQEVKKTRPVNASFYSWLDKVFQKLGDPVSITVL